MLRVWGFLGGMVWVCVRVANAGGVPVPEGTRAEVRISEKFAPGLRLRLHDKAQRPIEALVVLGSPLPQRAVRDLRGYGLELLRVENDYLLVRGTADPLRRLAARPEVLRLEPSRSLKPQTPSELPVPAHENENSRR